MDQHVTAEATSPEVQPSERTPNGEKQSGLAWRKPIITRLSLENTLFVSGSILDGHSGSNGG